MATPELSPGEEYDINGVHVWGVWEDGEYHNYVLVNGWAKREFDLELDDHGGHIDFIEYEDQAPPEENAIAFSAIAALARIKKPEITTVEDTNGNLL